MHRQIGGLHIAGACRGVAIYRDCSVLRDVPDALAASARRTTEYSIRIMQRKKTKRTTKNAATTNAAVWIGFAMFACEAC